MNRRILLALSAFVVIGLTVVAVAQSPVSPPTVPPAEPAQPATPRPLPAATAPVGSVPPVAFTETPLAQFEPLSAYPHQTQAAVRGVLLGANWMTRMNQPQGRFTFGYNPALRQAIPGDHDLKQARGALGLAQAARFTGDEKQAVIASQAILTLLAATKLDPADPNCRVPVHASVLCNRVGFASLVALAIYELPAADAKLLTEAEKLCEFLRRQCKPDGSVHYTDNASEDPTKVEPDGVNEFPGMAFHAIMAGNRVKPAAWKADTVKKGLEHYRAMFRTKPHPLMAATLTPAFAEHYMQTKSADSAAAVYEMTDWLCGLQIPGNDPRTPQWAGAFRGVVDGRQADIAPGPETGLYVQSLAFACVLTRMTPDLDRHAKYKAAITDAVQFLTGMQYVEANTRHFETTFRANMLIGGFHLSPTDGNLRIDATGTAMTGLVRFLLSGAEK
ncbi:MAG: hypothetical protein C0467_06245 [Planctomycetaceae bacterium]|nr:hypothetical protein [Planctomycetaceae bacterium]